MSLFSFIKFKFNKDGIVMWLRRLAGLVMILTYLMAVIFTVRLNILPAKYLVPIIVASGLAESLLAYLCFRSKISKLGIVITIFAATLMTFCSILVLQYGSLTTSFLDKIQNGSYTYIEYSVVAKKDQHIKLNSNQGYSVGLYGQDINSIAVKERVDRLTKVDFKSYDNITNQVVSLETNESNMLVLSSSSIDLIKDSYSDFYQNIEVLATFKIKASQAKNTSKVDVLNSFIVYISGIDSYGAINTVSRSDVNILAIVNPKAHKILLVNTPRDYYVQLHGTTGFKDKLTHAGTYGIDMSIATLEDLYGVNIDYFVRVNFSSLVDIVDKLGGVSVSSNYTFSSNGCSFTRGTNNLNGKQALAFSRARYNFASGDRTRGENQQLVIEAIINKLNSPSTLLNYQSILASIQPAIQTDIDSGDITKLAKNQLEAMAKWTVESTAVDGSDSRNYTYSMGNIKLYVMEPNQVSIDTAKAKIKANY